MMINGKHHRSLRFDQQTATLYILDQTLLPFHVEWLAISTFEQICHAIRTMQVRGAPAIGAVAAYGMVFAVNEGRDLHQAAALLNATRPTAVNLAWAVSRIMTVLSQADTARHGLLVVNEAAAICEEDIAACSAIGDAGCTLIDAIAARKQGVTVNILTHCNAGWLATVDWGTALAPIYKAQANGIDVHVWVDETRPRNQGALLTAFELKEQGVKHTLICDNAGGHLMQHGMVDICIVGSDRTAANGDVCNKIGTYLKALAAADNQIPFYVALPVSTIDWQLDSGRDIPIEQRSSEEVLSVYGMQQGGQTGNVRIAAEGVQAANPAFDVTPARYVTGLITEHGIVDANPQALATLKARL